MGFKFTFIKNSPRESKMKRLNSKTKYFLNSNGKYQGLSLTGSECMSTCGAFRTDPRSARCRAGVPRMPLRGVPSTLELGVPYISGELASISLCKTG